MVADISLEQAVFGATMPVAVRTAVRCDDCGGSGAAEWLILILPLAVAAFFVWRRRAQASRQRR